MEIGFPAHLELDEALRWAEREGIDKIGLASLRHPHGWTEVVDIVSTSTAVSVAYLCHASMFTLDAPSSWDASTQSLLETIDAAVSLGAGVVYATTGPAWSLDFEDAAEALSQAVEPAREYASAAGVQLLAETANVVFAGTHFLHTLQDTIDAASHAGIGVCLDIHETWRERNLHSKIRSSSSAIGLVQVSDFVPGNLTMTRDVIGEGVIPLKRILGTVLDTGYSGTIDVELIGRPEATAKDDILRSVDRLSSILYQLGV